MIHHLPHGQIHHARVEAVYPLIEPGSVTLVHSDGPYGMNKAEWDKVRDLAAWYRPHIAEWGRLCAPSASVYLWNTHGGLIDIDPEMRAAGWERRAVVTWDKTNAQAQKATEGVGAWPDATEVCGLYQREPDFAGFVDRELRACGLSSTELARRVTGNATGAVRNWAWYGHGIDPENWGRLHRVLNDLGPEEVLPKAFRWRLQIHQSVRRLSEAEARAEYEASRCPFRLPPGVTNVWSHPQVQGAERLTGLDGATLHPCQKPLLFARRIVEASSRPGDLVFEPFAGTARIAAACEDIARWEPEKARRYVCVEMDEDGRGYIPAVLASLRGESTSAGPTGQVPLFAAGGAA